MAKLLNYAETKRIMIQYAHEHTNPYYFKYERVSKDAIEFLERKHYEAIKELVDSQRGKGITIKGR
jgi:hypothetical protein